MKRTSTYFPKPNEIPDAWRVIDATGRPLGRLARDIAVALQGKDKPTYTPHMITGDHVVVLNAAAVITTGKKSLQKIDINDMTPLDALSKLDELKKKYGI